MPDHLTLNVYESVLSTRSYSVVRTLTHILPQNVKGKTKPEPYLFLQWPLFGGCGRVGSGKNCGNILSKKFRVGRQCLTCEYYFQIRFILFLPVRISGKSRANPGNCPRSLKPIMVGGYARLPVKSHSISRNPLE